MHASNITNGFNASQETKSMLKLSACCLVICFHSLVQADASPALSCQNMVKPNLQSKLAGKLPSGLSQIQARFHVDDANQIDRIELEGPMAFHPIVREAIEQYKCNPVEPDRWFKQFFSFRLDLQPMTFSPNLVCSHLATVQLDPSALRVKAGDYLVRAVFSWDKDNALKIHSLEGPQAFTAAVLETLKRYECPPEQVMEQEFQFRIQD